MLPADIFPRAAETTPVMGKCPLLETVLIVMVPIAFAQQRLGAVQNSGAGTGK
jgi:hypothetical protein